MVGRGRPLFLLAFLVGAAALYLLLMTAFDVAQRPTEREFGAAPKEARLSVYVQPLSVDVADEAMQIRITLLPAGGRSGAGAIVMPDRDLTLVLRHGDSAEQIEVHARQPFPAETVLVDLYNGSVRDYPFDKYRTTLNLQCQDKAAADSGSPDLVPVHMTVWEEILGYQVKPTEVQADRPGEVRVELNIRRTGAVRFFATAMFVAMVVLGTCSAVLGALVFLGARKIEVTMVGAIGAMVFALPVLRRALPSDPPLGIRADVLIYFWAEIAVVSALALFVFTWSRSGPRP